MVNKKPVSLYSFIFAHYARSALIPILTIELLLLIIYFAVNAYTNTQSRITLEREVSSTMPHMVQQQADLINSDFQSVQRQTRFFAQAHEDLFAHPEVFRVIGDPPMFEVAPTGALYQTNRTNFSSLYFTHASRLNASQLDKARRTAALDAVYIHMVKDTPHVVASYFNTPDNMNRLYPFIPKAYEQYPPDLTMADYNFYYLADEKHNPQKKTVWTGAYLDPAGQGWMVSCIAPVYHTNRLEGVVGLDVTIANIVGQVLSLNLPWGASAFLADQAGMILAMSPKIENLLKLTELKQHTYNETIAKEKLKPEEYNLFKAKDAHIAALFKTVYASPERIHDFSVKEDAERFFIVQSDIKSTGWKLFVVIDSQEVMKSVNAVAKLSHQIGLGLVVIMFLFYVFFFLFLRSRARIISREIAAPTANLAEAARTLGTGAAHQNLPLSGISEIDELTNTFSRMESELDGRSKALVESEVRAKVQAKESQLSYARGMFESASGYLHNVGNSIAKLESSLLELDEIAKSTEQYPAVFTKISEGSDPSLMDRFRSVLVDKTSPKLKEAISSIRRVKDNIQQTIKHQQRSFKDVNRLMIPIEFDLCQTIKEAVAEVEPDGEQIMVMLNLPDKCLVLHHRIQVFNGLANLIKNAIEACRPNGKGEINIALCSNEDGFTITVKDNGTGILQEHRDRIMTAGFTTKPDGNGLGLHAFAVFLSANQGNLSLISEGAGRGATATVSLHHARL